MMPLVRVARWLDGRWIAEDQSCPCGHDALFRDCCIRLAERGDIDVRDRIYLRLSYRDLWPTQTVTTADLHADLDFFEPEDLTTALSMLGYLAKEGASPEELRHNLALVSELFPAAWLRKVQLWLESGRAHALAHPHMTPSIVQQVMGRRPTAGDGALVAENNHRLGALLLRFNEFAEPDLEAAAGDSSESPDTIRAAAFRYLFNYHDPNFGSLIGRMWGLFVVGIPAIRGHAGVPACDLEGLYSEMCGLDLRSAFAYCMSLLAYYADEEALRLGRKPFVLSAAPFSGLAAGHEARGMMVLTGLAWGWEQHATAAASTLSSNPENWSRYQDFYERPFLRLASGGYVPLVHRLMMLRLTEGTYWELYMALRRARRNTEARTVNAYVGCLAEWYAAEMLCDARERTPTFIVGCDWRGELAASEGESKPDFVVVAGNTAFVIEVTTMTPPPSTATQLAPENLEAALVEYWIEGRETQRRGKMIQLQASVDAVRTGRVVIAGQSLAGVDRFVPVLCTLRSQPNHPILSQYYREVLLRNGIESAFVEDVQLIDFEELEQLAELAGRGHDWATLFDSRAAGEGREQPWTHYLWATGLDQQRHRLVQRWMESAVEENQRFLSSPLVP